MPTGLRLGLLIDARQYTAGQARALARLRDLLLREGIVHVYIDAAQSGQWQVVEEADMADEGLWPCLLGPDGRRIGPALESGPGAYSVDLSDRCLGAPRWWTPDEWLQYLLDAFDRLDDEAQASERFLVLLLHPQYSGRAGANAALEQFLRYVAERDGVGWSALDAMSSEA